VASSEYTTRTIVPELVRSGLSCSTNMPAVDTAAAFAIADACLEISKTTPGGLGNFRFCAASCIPPYVPFFPTAYCEASSLRERQLGFAIGFENGALATSLLRKTKTVANVGTVFLDGCTSAYAPLVPILERIAAENKAE
jgi:hypothetical protein